MCYYNNRYIDASYCEGGSNFRPTNVLTGFDNTVCATGPTGPTGPCCNKNDNIASITNQINPETLTQMQMVALSPEFISGDSISVIDGSNYITLKQGSYFISYSSLISPLSTPLDAILGFIIDNDIIPSSVATTTFSDSNARQLVKNFLLNILDENKDIALVNNSNGDISLSNLVISIIKVG